MKRIARFTLWVAALALSLAGGHVDAALGQQAPAQEAPTASAPTRQIAPAMSYVYADWLTRPERQSEELPDRLIKALEIPEGSTVIDLGAGVGYFTWRLAKSVGPTGKVIATDIQPEMIDLLAGNLRRRGIQNVDMVLSSQEEPRLPEGVADLVLLVDVYHELAYPNSTMRAVRRSLKHGGRLVVVEYRKEDPDIPIHPLHKMTVGEVRSEIEPTGFELLEVMEFLPSQHVIVFTPDSR